MKLFFNKKIFWLIVLFLALMLRLYGLDLNPVGLMHDDELHEIINAKSLALTGLPAPGRVAGIISGNDECPGNCVYGELGSYILIPWMWIFPLSLFWSKIPFVLASVGLVFFTGKLFENLSNNSKIGILAGLAVAINPWAIHFGRTSYATIFSFTFYILSAYIFTRSKSYKSNLIIGILFSLVASLFYFGTKPIMPLIIIWGIFYNLYQFKKHSLKFTSVLIAITILVIGGYLVLLSNSYAGRRFNELDISGVYDTKTLVDQQRRVSLEIPVLRDIAINKYMVEADLRIKSTLGFFSPTFLFLKSEGSTDNYYVSNHGYYYLIDAPFLVFGILALAFSFKKGLFILSLILLSITPAAIKTTGDTVYALRTGLAYPLMSGVIAWGGYYLYGKLLAFKKINLAKIFIVLITLVYIVSLSYFLIMYWYRTPIDKSMGWYHHKRILINYIQRLRQESNKEIIVVTAQPTDTFNTFVFFSGLYNNRDNIIDINNVYRSRNYYYKGILFVNNCRDITIQDLAQKKIIFIESVVKCDIDQTNTSKIANPRDGGGIYNIINDSLCFYYPKNKYPYPRYISDFKVEDLSKEKFCKMWITNPDQQ